MKTFLIIFLIAYAVCQVRYHYNIRTADLFVARLQNRLDGFINLMNSCNEAEKKYIHIFSIVTAFAIKMFIALSLICVLL